MFSKKHPGGLAILIMAGLFLLNCGERSDFKSISEAHPENILRHSTSLYSAIAFFIGTQLDIFTRLDEKPMAAAEAAEAMEIKPHFMERLLYALAAAEMLEVKQGIFSNTPESSRYLVKGKPDYLGDHVLVNPLLKYWMFFAATVTADTLRNGTASQALDYAESDFETLLETFRGTMPVAVYAGRALAKHFDLSSYKTLADVGGASGGLAVSLHKAYPHLDITVTDLSSVTPVAQALLKEQGASGIDVLEWDVLAGSCRRTFDVVVLRALIQVLPADQAYAAIENIAASLNPGGQLILMGHVMDSSLTSPPEEVIWYLLNLNWEDHAGFFSEDNIREMLIRAGLTDIQRTALPNGDQVMWGRKPN